MACYYAASCGCGFSDNATLPIDRDWRVEAEDQVKTEEAEMRLSFEAAVEICLIFGFRIDIRPGCFIHAEIGEGYDAHGFSVHYEDFRQTVERFCEVVAERADRGLLK